MSEGLTKVTVYLTPRAASALEDAARITGDTKTDTINRALGAYNLLMQAWAREGGGAVTFEVTPGEYVRVTIAPST